MLGDPFRGSRTKNIYSGDHSVSAGWALRVNDLCRVMIRKKITFIFAVFFATIFLMALQKPVFLIRYAEMSQQASWVEWLQVVGHGLMHDLTVAGYVTALPVLVILVSLWVRLSERVWTRILKVYFWIVSLFSAMIFAVDLGLYEHWGFRIDSTILIYLVDPKEAMASVDWAMGVTYTLVFILWTALMVWCYNRWVVGWFDGEKLAWRKALLWTPVVILLGGMDFVAVRGGVSASVANISKVYFSSNMFLNHAATNPVFSFLRSLGKTEDFSKEYPFFTDEECAAKFEAIRGNGNEPTAVQQVLKTKRPNVVVVLMESFARTIMDTEETGERVMPHLDRLKEEGIWFENFFANSFRTDRGEVAVLSGFPAQTKVSIMKLPGKSRNLPSLARSLGRMGYSTHFYYGGDLNFTDQSSYMYATGWQKLTWQKDLKFDRAPANWGWDDEVMCDYFADQVIAKSKTGQPFLAGFLTLSSHTPFDVPYAKFEHKMLNAAAFTDECLGRMIDKLKASSAWDNLLIVMVADHGYPYPESLMYNEPLRHRIPMIWTGGAVAEHRVVEDYASQIDICATILGQMDLAHDDFDYSKDIFAEDQSPKFAYYAFDNGFGVVDSEGEVVWDCTSDRLLRGDRDDLLTIGKTMLQTTYRDISRR